MKYINDLAYLTHIAQIKQAAKDKKQKNKYRQTVLLNNDAPSDEESDAILDDLPIIEKESDRRVNNDRRKTQHNRGRYIESRLNKDRRYKKEVYLVV